MSLSKDYKKLSSAERSLWRQPMMWLSAAAIAAVPLLYATIYLGSSLDPYGNLSNLPVGLVNLDSGALSQGKTYQLGQDVVKELRDDKRFNYFTFSTQAAAEQAVRQGDTYFALTIPAEFSRKALSADSAQHGLLNFYVSEGGSYFASRVASTFADTLSTNLNKTLGENRWEVVQTSLAKVQSGFADLKKGAGQLRDGATTLENGTKQLKAGASDLASGAQQASRGGAQLASGATSLSSGVGRLTEGSGKLAAGLRQLEAAAPGAPQLAPLQQGAAKLSSGSASLARGLGQLSAGAGQLATGAKTASSGAQQLAAGNKQLASQLPQLAQGLSQAAAGSDQLNVGAAQVATGAKQLREATQNQVLLPAALKTGVAQLQSGATQVHAGSNALTQALTQLTSGAQQASSGAAQLSAGAAELSSGTAQLESGATTLASKLKEAQAGSSAAVTGAQKLGQGAAKLSSGTAQLQRGAATLGQKAAEAARGAAQLSSGAKSLQEGVGTLVVGNLKVKGALGSITAQLPSQSDLGQLKSGASTLARKSGELSQGLTILSSGAAALQRGSQDVDDGAVKLRQGLNTLYNQIPAQIEQLGGDPAGLSTSVQPVVQKFAAAKNNGVAFAPYFMALSLWVGVTLTTFIFPYQQVPQSGRATSQVARMLRKAAVPAVLVTVQALLVVLGVHLLGVNYLHPLEVVVTAVASSLTFLTLVLGFIFLFGAAGRLLALVLLIVQLAASGGSYPVELSPPFFRAIHSFIPVTQSVNAFRHAITGAFEGKYPQFLLVLLAVAVVGVLLGLLGRRRWEIVPDDEFKPLISSPVSSGH